MVKLSIYKGETNYLKTRRFQENLYMMWKIKSFSAFTKTACCSLLVGH